MREFKEVLYESLLFSFGKVLAEYNVFARETVLREVGREIIEYLRRNGFPFSEENTMEDASRLVEFFAENGFARVEVTEAEFGTLFRWDNLYGIQAYAELQTITENPFLSCPLNACVHHIAGKHGKTLRLHSKSFDLETGVAYSEEEFVDSSTEVEDGFDSLVIENRRLLNISEKHQTALREALEEVRRLASTDHLTGLKNRRQLLQLAEQEFQGARRFHRELSAIMLDVDHFKPINDTYGHAVGDAVLKMVAGCCAGTMRKVDVIGRYGGDEFVIVLPQSDLPSSMLVAERLGRSISCKPVETEKGPVNITVSQGVTTLREEHSTLNSLLISADNALYVAKKNGGNRVSCL